MVDVDYQLLIEYIRRHISIDGNLYKERPFKRRLAVRMRYTGKSTYKDYLDFLRASKEELQRLKETLTINVTRFFRNRETFDYLEEALIKDLVRRKNKIRILSAGSSTGEEAYTLSIIFNRQAKHSDAVCEIVGIDVDAEAVEKAKIGLYNEYSFMEMRSDEINKYFSKAGSNFKINEEIKKNVDFIVMDIKESESLSTLGYFDIIVCRNILIYFSKDFQEKIMSDFYRILVSEGYMLLGKVEILTGQTKDFFETINRKERIFRKIDNKHQNS